MIMLSVLYTTCSQVEVKKAENSSKPMGGKSGYPQGRQYASCCVWLCVYVCVCAGYGASRMYGGGYPSPGGYSQMTPQQQQQQQAGAYGYGCEWTHSLVV